MNARPLAYAQRYDLHEHGVAICCDVADMACAVRDVLVYFGFDRRADDDHAGDDRVDDNRADDNHADVSLRFEHTPERPVRLPASRPTASRHSLSVWAMEERVVFSCGTATADLRPAEGTGYCEVTGAWRDAAGYITPDFIHFVIHAVLVLLRRRALYPLHAAALSSRRTDGLIVADAGQGKSTLATSFVLSGWSFLSDDSVVLSPGRTAIDVLPLRRTFALDAATLRLVPDAAALSRSSITHGHKRSIDLSERYPDRCATRSTPNILLMPVIVPAATSRLEPASRQDAMHALLSQSPLLMLDAATARRHIEVLDRLSRQVRAFRLFSGRDVLENPRHAIRTIGTRLSHHLDDPVHAA